METNGLPIGRFQPLFSTPNISIIEGDALEVMKGFPDGSIDLIVTDPPYGIDYLSNMQFYDNRSSNQYAEERDYQRVRVREDRYFDPIVGDDTLQVGWLGEAYRLLRDGSAIYIFCHWTKWGELSIHMAERGFKVKNMIVINKSNHGMGDLEGAYAPKHELLMFATKGRHLLEFPKKRLNDIWDCPIMFNRDLTQKFHPNQKPVAWIEPAVLSSSKVNDIVLDPFFGSGTTGMACLKNGRNCIGIEIEPKYCKIAEERTDRYH